MKSKNALSRRNKTFLEKGLSTWDKHFLEEVEKKVYLREISTFYMKLEMRSNNALSRRI